MATVAALFGIEESRTLWAVWGTTQLHIGARYRSVRSGEWLVTFRCSSSDNPWTLLVNHPCLCLIAPISQHIMLPQSTVATALIFNWVGLPQETKSLRSYSGNRAKMLLKGHLGIMTLPIYYQGHQTPSAQFSLLSMGVTWDALFVTWRLSPT